MTAEQRNSAIGAAKHCQEDHIRVDSPPSAAVVLTRVMNRVRDRSSACTKIDHKVWVVVESLAYPFVLKTRYLDNCHKFRGRIDRGLFDIAVALSKFLENDRYQDLAKYWTARWAARCFGDEVEFPEKAEYEQTPIFRGFLHTLLKRVVRKRDMDFAYSLLQSKRMWPSLGLSREREALLDHRVLLSRTPKEIPEEMMTDLTWAVDSFLRFSGKELPSWTSMAPSVKGHFGAPASSGGALGMLRRKPVLSPEADNIRKYMRSRSLQETVVRGEMEKKRLFELAREGRDAQRILPGEARVVIIPEPAKFRIVTCGDPELYTAVKPVQSALLQAWSKHPTSTMKVADLGAAMSRWNPRTFACSGDYKSATDTLEVLASLYCLDRILRAWKVPPWLYASCMDTLIGVVLHYPPKFKIPDLDQINGQLMGSPLSFVLLCIINLATWRAATKRRAKFVWDVFINGDDIAFTCEREEYEAWLRSSSAVGFVQSLGKSYLSRRMVVINSQLYRYPAFTRVGYLNLKLVRGSSLKAGHSDAYDFQVGRAVSEMCELSPWTIPCIPQAMRAAKAFLPGANWYIPAARGGCGVSIRFAPDDVEVTRWQLKLAGASFMDPTLSLGVAAQVPGLARLLRLLRRPKMVPLPGNMREGGDLYAHILPGFEDEDYVSRTQRRERQLVWEAWFQRLISLQSLFLAEVEDAKVSKVRQEKARLKALEKWRLAAQVAHPVSISKLFDIIDESLYPALPAVPRAWLLA